MRSAHRFCEFWRLRAQGYTWGKSATGHAEFWWLNSPDAHPAVGVVLCAM